MGSGGEVDRMVSVTAWSQLQTAVATLDRVSSAVLSAPSWFLKQKRLIPLPSCRPALLPSRSPEHTC